MTITAGNRHFRDLNAAIQATPEAEVTIENCCGQRYIAAGLSGKQLTIHGVPGNALGAYMDGGSIVTDGNVQDAVGDTMNDGVIVVHGHCGDSAGYAMRGGQIYIQGNVGYRAGIHMKAYKEKLPVLVVGGCTGSFLGEYQAGGLIIVLGLHRGDTPLTGYFCGTGMHGGRMFLRCEEPPANLPAQITVQEATDAELAEIAPYIDAFCGYFGEDREQLLHSRFFVLTPNSKNPYKQLYTYN